MASLRFSDESAVPDCIDDGMQPFAHGSVQGWRERSDFKEQRAARGEVFVALA
jgi:hypothetical protein